MGEVLSYSIVCGLAMLALYLGYRLSLARDMQLGFNRAVLLLIYLVSFVAVPVLLSIQTIKVPSATMVIDIEGDVMGLPAVAGSPHHSWASVLLRVFVAGMAIVAVRTAVTWYRLARTIRSGRKVERGGYTLVVTANDKFAPFSWMQYVVISEKDYHDDCQAIIVHELKHVVSCHWIDLLIAQAICIINWFNPAAWLMRDELMLVHEYQADMAVIDSGHDPQEYQMLLIKKAVGSRFPSLANSLNHSKLKKRITMMYKSKSGAGRRFKALALVPMLALALGVASMPAVRAAVSAIGSSEISDGKVSENTLHDQISNKATFVYGDQTPVQSYKVTGVKYDDNETTIICCGEGLGSSVTVAGGKFYLGEKTWDAKSLRCDMNDGVATMTVTFPFDTVLKFLDGSGDSDPMMSINVNGNEILFNLAEVLCQSLPPIAVSDDLVIAHPVSKQSNTSHDGYTIYVDGTEMTGIQLNSIAPEAIESIEVDKNTKTLKISLKK